MMHEEELQELIQRFTWAGGSHAYATGEFGQQVDPSKSLVGRPVSIRPCTDDVEDKTYQAVAEMRKND